MYMLSSASAAAPEAYAYGPMSFSSTQPAAPGNAYSWTFDVGATNFGGNEPRLPFTINWNVSVMQVNGGERFQAVTITSNPSGSFKVTSPSNNTRQVTVSWTTNNECGGTIELRVTAKDKNGVSLRDAYKGFGVNAGPTCYGSDGTGGTGTGGTGGTGTGGTGSTGLSTGGTTGGSGGGSGAGSGISSQPSPQPQPNPTPAPSPAPVSSSTSAAKQSSSKAPIAQKQSNTPAPIPEASSQGSSETVASQPPSAFFDGKQYAPGITVETAATTSRLIASKPKLLLIFGVLGVVVLFLLSVHLLHARKQKIELSKHFVGHYYH